MRVAIKLVLIAVSLATVPAAAAILGSGRSFPSERWRTPGASPVNISFQEKDPARIEPAAMGMAPYDVAMALIELAQAPPAPNAPAFPAGPDGGHERIPPRPGFFGPGGPAGMPGPFGGPPAMPGTMAGAMPPPSPRLACEEAINRHMALAGYLKGKLRLQGSQKDAWQKIEQAADPAVDKMRDLCAQLPSQMSGPPTLPDGIDLAEKQLAARGEFLRAIREPVRALYETLSPDQRAALNPPGARLPPAPF
jgi:hypothetical protein